MDIIPCHHNNPTTDLFCVHHLKSLRGFSSYALCTTKENNTKENTNTSLGWWFQPIWKIWSSNWESFANMDEHKTYLSCHHLASIYPIPYIQCLESIWIPSLTKNQGICSESNWPTEMASIWAHKHWKTRGFHEGYVGLPSKTNMKKSYIYPLWTRVLATPNVNWRNEFQTTYSWIFMIHN